MGSLVQTRQRNFVVAFIFFTLMTFFSLGDKRILLPTRSRWVHGRAWWGSYFLEVTEQNIFHRREATFMVNEVFGLKWKSSTIEGADKLTSWRRHRGCIQVLQDLNFAERRVKTVTLFSLSIRGGLWYESHSYQMFQQLDSGMHSPLELENEILTSSDFVFCFPKSNP